MKILQEFFDFAQSVFDLVCLEIVQCLESIAFSLRLHNLLQFEMNQI